MQNIKTIKLSHYVWYLSLIIISSFGCKKLVEVPPPKDFLATNSVFASDNTTIAAQLGVYAQMQNTPFNISAIVGLSADELKNYSTNTFYKNLYANALNASTDASSLPWSKTYNLIYQENAVIENIQSSTKISNRVKTQTIGEAKFMRAFWYFYLVNLYGDVPLITTTDYTVNTVKSRTSKSLVYDQIILDLTDAQKLLSSNYLDATDSVVTSDRVRPTKWSATALLARAYLYNKQYKNAEIEASTIINNTALFGIQALDDVFLSTSREAIFQILPPSTTKYTPEGNSFILSTPPTSSSTNCFETSAQLLAAFEPGDKRKEKWIKSFTNGTSTWYFPYKYKDNSVAPPSQTREYSMVLRLAEVYLVRAEARAQQENIGDAQADLNIIRLRAGLPVTTANTKDQLIGAILQERRVELFCEWGHRWFDLKRTGNIDAVMVLATPQKGGVWNANQQLYPLPTTELQNALNLNQNPGY